MSIWTPSSWREKPITQQPTYPDMEALKRTEKELSSYPPLVFAGEARNLKKQLGDVANGKDEGRFLINAGSSGQGHVQTGRSQDDVVR